jgi:hypothetical protein
MEQNNSITDVKSTDKFYQLGENQRRVTGKIKDFIVQNLIFLVLIFNIALEIASKLYRVGFQNPFTIEFFLELSISITTSMICYISFIPFGKSEEKKQNSSYYKNIDFWGVLSDMVRTGHNNLFREFCLSQVDVEREEKRRAIIGNATIIPFETYVSEYMGKSRKYIINLCKSGMLTRKESRAINKANGNNLFSFLYNPIKVKPINPVIILSGVRRTQINDAGRSDRSYTANWLISRPFIIFATNAIFNAITTSFIGNWQNAVFDMFLSVLLVIMASICGYSAGVTSIRKENDKVKNRILFLSLFSEKNGLKIEK